jgi:hypothetical protein
MNAGAPRPCTRARDRGPLTRALKYVLRTYFKQVASGHCQSQRYGRKWQ